MTTPHYIVVETEYERGWGSRDLCAKEFDCVNAAQLYVRSVNAQNTQNTAPDWYIAARLISDPQEIQYYKKML
jgi:hypothetical protein